MKQKVISLNLIILFLLLINFSINVNANDFGIGVKNGQDLVWKCNVCNIRVMDNIFGNDWNDSGILNNLSKGKKMRWEIINIELNESILSIRYDFWDWTSENIWGIKDNQSQITYFSNPNDYTQILNFSNYPTFVPFWFPTPVGDYIGALNLNEWYDVDNRVLPTINVNLEKNILLSGIPSEDIQIIAIYNDQGILNSYKIYIEGNIVILDISFEFLPFYVIPTLIGLFSGLSLGIILYLIKKRKSVKRKDLYRLQ